MSMTLGGDAESATIPIAAPTETPASRFRKIAYLSSGLGANARGDTHARERVTPRTKWLVVVVPPTTFPQEPGHLGHTLSSGPSSRLSSGLLMPLFPTMYGQLSAIAKEFNFPSTTGLCLYLHVTESGFTFTPRISDESWQLLWGHLFEARSPVSSTAQLPISGRIEFDIDLRKARWYDAWIASSQRDAYDVPMSMPGSRAPSVVHARHDSRTTFAEDNMVDDQVDTESVTQRTRTMRHVPRKLSLLDRFDTLSARSVSRAPSQAEISPPKPEHSDHRAINSLSPIVQEEEPKSAKNDLESRVRNWRASSSVAPTPLAATGQFSLDPVNMPNIVSLDSPVVEGEYELNLDDFTWSISSAGPEEFEYDVESVSSGRVLSVHMDRRAEGSVCLTPSVCTSYGPEDYDDLYSPVSNVDRLPSPDLGQRMLESVPPTPSTATSWGPDDYAYDYLYSPISNVSRLPSPDLGRRMLSSPPPTPSTATSWGPSSSYPPSPVVSEGYAQSVDIGLRNDGWSRPNTPSTATSWGPFESYPPSPATPYYIRTPDAGERAFDLEMPAERFSFPYYNVWTRAPWRFVWPYTRQREPDNEQTLEVSPPDVGAAPQSPFGFPYYRARQSEPWSMVWPYRIQKEDRDLAGDNSVRLSAKYPRFDLYPAVYPHLDIYPPIVPAYDAREKVSVAIPARYPTFSLYPAVYPCLEIYPGYINVLEGVRTEQLTPKYPTFSIYPAVYPHFEIYPEHVCGTGAASLAVSLSRRIISRAPKDVVPSISAGVYPHLQIYPSIRPRKAGDRQLISVTLFKYPVMKIYPASYPHMEIYPGHVHSAEVEEPIIVSLPSAYPALEIYRAVYPWSLISIYPAHRTYKGQPLSAKQERTEQYPDFDIYPAIHDPSRDEGYYKTRSVELKARYPAFDLYSALYPHFNIYPSASGPVCTARAGSGSQASKGNFLRGIDMRLSALYPSFNLYPAAYPHFDIYPACFVLAAEALGPSRLSPRYPFISLYPAVYPSFEIYPGVVCDGALPGVISVRLVGKYPTIRTYEAIYPHLDIYPAASCASMSAVRMARSRRTHAELHEEVFSSGYVIRKQPWKTHLQLHEEVLASGATGPRSESPPRGNVSPTEPARRRVSFASDTVIEPAHASAPAPRITRSRSGTVKLDIPPVPPLPPQFVSKPAPSPKPSPLRGVPRNGLPLHPAQKVRPISVVVDTMAEHRRTSSSSSQSSNAESWETSPSARVARTKSMIMTGMSPESPVATLDRSNSLNDARRPSRPRNSLVSERMKAFDNSSSSSSSERSDPDGTPVRITLNTLSQFPMPPAPKAVPIPDGRRRISKLDRSKYPFA
ncbi:hypothetical protein GLOTRDRAFT_125804 [Gloeophyllum trabeum ATCC 11539]|uniref:Uncharacterized protein n=1 Tax=Gloeophyllum trabeum (strain ATCC 11539 / FP-39264 / Madison 617) TaxID=670483 RepID=S7QIR0_GLOTA|nr:uncharacterized protein GLOTRDRAFT_125804 [Gloeophyllum trabeum ATCC 11539]EPQ59496.1 hypothetical protein GLOTRDRAFT_125804 [Gloeophyllum trabeum ATCC 11539]